MAKPQFSGPVSTLRGVIPPVVTPMLAYDQLDLSAIDAVVDHLLNGGVSGLFLLGTTGEGPSLTYQMRYEMVERACARVRRRLPVLVCVTDTSLGESLALAEHASTCDATAIVAAAPFYFDASQASLVRWFTTLADESPLPVFLYNMPGCVGLHLELPTVQELSDHPNIVGIKDSSGDLSYFQQLCHAYRDDDEFAVFMGPEELLAEAVTAGANGGVCGGANLLPTVYSGLYRAAIEQDAYRIAELKAVVHAVFQKIYRDGTGTMNLIPALKLAMTECGLCQAVTAPPLNRLRTSHREQIVVSLPAILAMQPATILDAAVTD